MSSGAGSTRGWGRPHKPWDATGMTPWRAPLPGSDRSRAGRRGHPAVRCRREPGRRRAGGLERAVCRRRPHAVDAPLSAFGAPSRPAVSCRLMRSAGSQSGRFPDRSSVPMPVRFVAWRSATSPADSHRVPRAARSTGRGFRSGRVAHASMMPVHACGSAGIFRVSTGRWRSVPVPGAHAVPAAWAAGCCRARGPVRFRGTRGAPASCTTSRAMPLAVR